MSRRKHRPQYSCERSHGTRRAPATHVLRAYVVRVTPFREGFTYRVRLCRAHALMEVRQARFWGRAFWVAAYRFRAVR